ncbi:MAG: EipB family protein, partial [Candidatus Phaeomarinobacter sp.]
AGTGAPDAEEAEPGQELASLGYWPVQVSYFDPNDVSGLPDYEVAFRFYENGVSTGLVMDYGDLMIGADLMSLEILPRPEC